jgi:hypothetical protein
MTLERHKVIFAYGSQSAMLFLLNISVRKHGLSFFFPKKKESLVHPIRKWYTLFLLFIQFPICFHMCAS